MQEPKHLDLETIQKYGRRIYEHFNIIKLTGGEPTLHPQIKEIIIGMKEWTGCKELYIETNGVNLPLLEEMEYYLDKIIITRYNEATYPGCPSNEKEISKFMNSSKVTITSPIHEVEHDGGGHICQRIGIQSIFNGKIYPCCASPGIEGFEGVPLEKGWEKSLQYTPPPCFKCRFSK
jgi:hypothetical protein